MISCGDQLMVDWMEYNKRENPLNEEFDGLLEIVFSYDVTIILCSGLKIDTISDAEDVSQIEELVIHAELIRRDKKGDLNYGWGIDEKFESSHIQIYTYSPSVIVHRLTTSKVQETT